MINNNGDTSDWSDGDKTFTSPLELMEQMKNGGSMFIGQIKKQEYKHPQEQEVKDLKTVQEDGMDVTGHIGDDLAGDDLNLPTPDAFLEASGKQQSPKTDWRSHLSDSLLSTLPGTLKSPDPENLDPGAKQELEALKEMNKKEGAFRDQYDRKSGYRKPESYSRSGDSDSD
ncbi:hypothetical protein TrLO_g6046 [Triparma laevis f. longispina]|uniref:Uncharacterized protein n=1 Tax=Triparma laevis f. longispina TaxID=1714387 RepID=A0A9W7C910_9STRA|nr:hypothetical protein TrLO_g6046 [Triparma laevis f. longispina]